MSAAIVPSVEERWFEVEETLGLVLLATRAVSTAPDLGLSEEDQDAAWAGIDRLTLRALAHLRAMKRALKVETMNAPAPDAGGRRIG